MKISTKQDVQVVKSFQKHTYINQSKTLVILLIAIMIFGIILCVTKNYFMGGMLVSFTIFFALFYPLTLHVANNKLNKSSPTFLEEKDVEYEFLDTLYTVKSYVNGEEREFFKMEYNKVHKVDENKEYIFIYISNNMAHCIRKEDVTEEDLKNLRDILKNNNVKYKISKM